MAYSTSPGSGPPPAKKPKFAERMMAQMGWKKGEGLGTDGRGRLAPIETQLRPQGAGLGAVKEKTKQAKDEEKRAAAFRGETLEDSSEEERKKRRKKPKGDKSKDTSGISTPSSIKKRKPKYVTADEIKTELKGLNIPDNVLESAFDLTGKNVGYDSPATGFVAAQDDSEMAKASRRIQLELVACAETRHALNERKAYLDDTTDFLVGGLDKEKEELKHVQELTTVVSELQELTLSPEGTWENVTKRLKALELDYPTLSTVEKYGIHEIAIASIHPLFRLEMQEWEPPEINESLLTTLETLAPLLGHSHSLEPKDASLTHHSDRDRLPRRSKKHTTPYETLFYTLWLPRLRSYINTSWEPSKPSTLPDLLKRWRPLLPEFIFNHIITQLLIPQLATAVSSWKPSRSSTSSSKAPAPHTIIFPFLPLLPPEELDSSASSSLLSTARRRLRSALSTHPISSGPPAWLDPWKTLLGSSTHSKLLTNHLVPRLTRFLSTSFTLDPSDQEPTLPAFNQVLSYSEILIPGTLAAVLKESFLPSFKAVLKQWLSTEEARYDEVASWYEWWKSMIPASIREHEMLWADWTSVFDTMLLAADLGPARFKAHVDGEGQAQPGTPGVTPAAPASRPASGPSTPPAQAAPAPAPPPPHNPQSASFSSVGQPPPPPEVTFRDVLDEFAAEHDLLLVPLREAQASTGAPLLRLTASADQKGGVVGYVKGDVFWERDRKDKQTFTAVAVDEELVKRAGTR